MNFGKRIVFNRYSPPNLTTPASYIYSNDPVVQLNEGPSIARNTAQLRKLKAKKLSVSDLVFGTSLDWAFRGYIVHPLLEDDSEVAQAASTTQDDRFQNPLGTRPPRGVIDQERQAQLRGLPLKSADPIPDANVPPPDDDHRPRLCLFNVLVALEWIPTQRYLLQLEWAFQRASEFLYDITDSAMAFGQVVFGGPELMDCADIQIMASNRFMPRSFVNGLHDSNTYSPIRVGRGIWQKNNRVSVSWDEPEGYRNIVHEWGHYALALKDEYLSEQHVHPDTADKTLLRPAENDQLTLSIPGISLALETIMSTLAASELMPQNEQNSRQRRVNEWGKLAEKQEFAFLGIKQTHQPIDGPMRLPLPLPRFHRLDTLGGDPTPGQAPPANSADLILAIPGRIQPDHCWVYVIKGSTSNPKEIIAQGTIDARTEADGFRLLGASKGNTVVLIGLTPARAKDGTPLLVRPIVLYGAIVGTKPRPDGYHDAIMGMYEEATPDTFPIVDVLPVDPPNGEQGRPNMTVTQDGETGTPIVPRWINVHVSDGGDHTAQQWVFPLGESGRKQVTGQPIKVQSLDGHVFVGSKDGTKLTISTYSHGGGPGGSPPIHANPITAGSAEGNILLFFYDPKQGDEFYGSNALPREVISQVESKYSEVRVVTTMNHGIPEPSGTKPRSYTFSLASNTSLPRNIASTLVMFYDTDSTDEQGALRIYRLKDGKSWEIVATYLPHGLSFAATPLDNITAGGLFGSPLGVEHYRLCLVNR